MSAVVQKKYDFLTGTRKTDTLPLSNPESGESLYDGDELVSLEMLWPDHRDVVQAKNEWLAALRMVELELLDKDGAERTDVTPARFAELITIRDTALIGYCAALVHSWTVTSVKFTPEALKDLFNRAPFTLELVVNRSAEMDRFLRESRPHSATESAPPSEVAA